jgi:hypothetical protein
VGLVNNMRGKVVELVIVLDRSESFREHACGVYIGRINQISCETHDACLIAAY